MKKQEVTEFLDDVSVCFLDRDFDRWESRILLPFSLVTQAGPISIFDRAGLRENFDLYLSACKTLQLDAIYRDPLSLENCEDGTFILTYRTELLSKGKRQTAPYTSSALIVQSDGAWRMTSIMNARGHHDWTGRHPQQNRENPND